MRVFATRGFRKFAVAMTRVALAAGFLSAVADRFGVWGRSGQPNVSWGDFQHFMAHVQTLNPFAPKELVPVMAWVITVLEAGFGLALLVGVRTRTIAFGSACLLSLFALATVFSPAGIHGVLSYSLLSAAGAALLLAIAADDA